MSYASIAAIALLLWVVSQPLAGLFVVAGLVGVAAGTRRAVRLARCVRDCGAVAFALGNVRITVSRASIDEPN